MKPTSRKKMITVDQYNVDTYTKNPRRLQPLKDAVQALREETELEAVVSIVGGPEAQRAVREHRLEALVERVGRA